MVPGDASSLHPVKKKMIRMSGSNENLIIETLHITNIIRRYLSTFLIPLAPLPNPPLMVSILGGA